MANVKHILADGSRLDDISGHVVKITEAEAVYDLIKRINTKEAGRKNHNENQKTQHS